MSVFANRENKRFLVILTSVMAAFFVLQGVVLLLYPKSCLPVLLLSLMALCCIVAICIWYFGRQDQIIEDAISQIDAFLSGDTDARIDCDQEGTLYRLFHSVNTLAAILNAHATNELREKEFLKNTISDISHQLKMPLAALNIYNGLLQGEAEGFPAIEEFVTLSEQELDRMEMLVQNLLKITKLDAGSIRIEKHMENVADMMKDVELHFAYRVRQEQKRIVLSGSDGISFLCDRDWLTEAIDNVVKNALDHTESGDTIQIGWNQFASVVQITVEDDGSGIHPEDLHHIFKRFYRSRFSKDTQGVGLGLPLAKAIVEAHNGTIEVHSTLGVGSAFVMNFLIPTNL